MSNSNPKDLNNNQKPAAGRGPIYVLLCGVLFSIGGLCMKVVPWNALAINSVRCIISGLIMVIYARATHHKLKVNKPVLIGAAAMCATVAVYAMAVKATTAGAAIVIQFTVPIWTMLFSVLLFGKKPRKLDILACIFVFAGIAVCFYDGLAEGRTLGNLLAVISGITYSGVFMCNQSEGSDPISSVIIGQFASALIGLPFLIRSDFGLLDGRAIIALLTLGVFQLGLGYIFLTKGLETTPPVTACLLTGVEPVLNPVWVSLFYGEKVSGLFVVGAIVVLASVIGYELLDMHSEKAASAG